MRKLLIVLAVANGTLLIQSSVSRATTYTVSSTADIGPGTLRQAITDANGNLSATASSPHVINITIGGPIVLSSALPSIDNHITINGPSSRPLSLAIQGGATFRVFNVMPGRTVKMNYLVITGGHATDVGGGIRNAGTLTLTDCAVTGNSADVGGGGIANTATGNLTLSRVTVDNNHRLLNAIPGGGGGGLDLFGTAKLTNCTISLNQGDGRSGGGILAEAGTLTLINCTIAKNYAGNGGGGISVLPGATVKMHNSLVALNDSPFHPDISGTVGSSYGRNVIGNSLGAVLTGTLANNVLDLPVGLDPMLNDNGGRTRTHALLCGSPAIDRGTSSGSAPSSDQRGQSRESSHDVGSYEFVPDDGPFVVSNVLDNGDNLNPIPGSLRKAILDAIAGCGDPSVVDVTSPGGPVITLVAPLPTLTGNITIEGPSSSSSSVTVDGNDVAGTIFTIALGAVVEIEYLKITNGNSPDVGGGIKNGGTLTLKKCQVTSNDAAQAGAGIANLATGILTLDRSTVDNNRLVGALLGGAGIDNRGTATIENCTISSNDGGAGIGGGILNQAGTMALTHCTIAFNQALSGAGLARIGGTVKMSNTLVAGNDPLAIAIDPDIFGAVGSDHGHNLVGQVTAGTTLGPITTGNIAPIALDAVRLDPNLADNGGKTPTHALICGSPAINAAAPAVGLSSDQRGKSRSGAPDIGAFELIPDPGPFKVSTLADNGDNLNPLPSSLRQAVIKANASCANPAEITFSSKLAGTILLASPLDPLAGKITITGPASGLVTVSGNGNSRVFEVAPSSDVTISNLTITGGYSPLAKGGGIANFGKLTLTDCTISTNKAVVGGAGVFNDAAATLVMIGCTLDNNELIFAVAGNAGAGICNAGAATLTNCTLSKNKAGLGDGGGIANTAGQTTLQNCTLFANSAANGGGAAALAGVVNLENALLIGNVATAVGNDVYDNAGAGSFGSANGHNLVGDLLGATLGGNTAGNLGPIADPTTVLITTLAANGGLTATHALFCGSPAVDAGTATGAPAKDQRGMARYGAPDIGAYEFVPVPRTFTVTNTLDDGGPGSLRGEIAAAKASCLNPAIINVTATGTVTLGSGLKIESNMVINGPTAGVFSVSGANLFRVLEIASGKTVAINNLTFQDGRAAGANGGGILNQGSLSLANCTIRNNQTDRDGGGIANAAGASMQLNGCTVNGNSTSSATGIGGGLFNAGTSATLTNCTVSSNTSRAKGGGILQSAGTLRLLHCTVATNTLPGAAPNQGAGIHIQGGTADVSNSIVLANGAVPYRDVNGPIATGDYNVYGTITVPPSGTHNFLGATPGNILDLTLASNGGPTQTHALLCVTPLSLNLAIGSANPAVATPADQRGQARVGAPDRGAYEFNPPTLFVVNTLADNGDNNPLTALSGSLRKAILDANATCASPVVIDATGAPAGTILLVTNPLPALDNDVTINGRPDHALVVSGSNAFRVFDVNPGKTVNINHLTITHGRGAGGGGIRNAGTLSLAHCTLRSNHSTADGGAIRNTATTNLLNCTVTTNTSAQEGAGIYNVGATSALTLVGCTVDNNTTNLPGGGIGNNAGTAELKNCTLSGNRSPSAGAGGIFSFNGGTVRLTNCTVTNNSGPTGGGIELSSGTVEVNNTILAGNSAVTAPDIRATGTGSIISAIGGNLVGDAASNSPVPGSTPVANAADVLDPTLASNGGPTRTHALVPGGPAVNAGNDAVLGPPYNLITDQRGRPRRAEGTVDVGAYEFQPFLGPNLAVLPEFDGSFETGIVGFESYHSSRISRVMGGRDGSWALQVRGPSDTDDYFGVNDDGEIVEPTFAGTRYRYTAYVRSLQHHGTAQIRLREYDDDDKLQEVWSPPVTLTPEWQVLIADIVAISTGGRVNFQVVDTPLVKYEVFLVDAIAVNVVLESDTPPVVVAPTSASTTEGTPITFHIQAVDPEGQPITTLDAPGLPAGATFLADVGNGGGTFTWTPTLGQASATPYLVKFRAINSLTTVVTTPITVNAAAGVANLLPFDDSRFNGTFARWRPFAGATLALSADALSGPSALEVASTSPSTSIFGVDDHANWVGPTPPSTPSDGPRARYRFAAWVKAANATSLGSVRIAIREYSGNTQLGPVVYSPPVTLHPTIWQQVLVEYVTQLAGTSLDMRVLDTPLAGYERFLVDDVEIVHLGTISGLVATGGGEVGGGDDEPLRRTGVRVESAVMPETQEAAPARAFSDAPAVQIDAGSPWSVRIEGLVDESAIPLVAMRYGGGLIQALAGLTRMGEDADGNGVEEVAATFAAADLERLFGGAPGVRYQAGAVLTLNPGTSHALDAPLDLEVDLAPAPPRRFEAVVTPNPVRVSGELRFSLTRPGPVRVSMFDATGRRVATLMDEREMRPGSYSVSLGGAAADRAGLKSGLYFYRVESQEGVMSGRFVLIH